MNIRQINFARKHAAYCNYYRNFSAKKSLTPRQVATAGAAAASIPAAIAANNYLEKMGHNGILGVWKDAYNTYNENKALPPHIMTGTSSFQVPTAPMSNEDILFEVKYPSLVKAADRIGDKINADYITNGVNATPTHLSASDVVMSDGNPLSPDAIASLNKFGTAISNADWLGQ